MNFLPSIGGRRNKAFTVLSAILISLGGATIAAGQTVPTTPTKTVVPVRLDAASGAISIGATTYPGTNPGFHIVAISRQPDLAQLDAPDLIWDRTYYNNPNSVLNDLTNLRTTNPDAMILINAVGNYGFGVGQVSAKLNEFGLIGSLDGVGTIPLLFIGISGLPQGGASLQRGNVTAPANGYLAQDSNGNYAFVQMDFVRYNIATNGDISIGGTKYPVSTSYLVTPCDGNNSFHFVIVDRVNPSTLYGNNTYCTGSSDSEIGRLVGDLRTLTSNLTDESRLVFIATNGNPIPSNSNFGTNGDARFYPLGQVIRQLGGFWETIVYLKPGDTYSLVGAPPPPNGTKGANKRARESSSIYPEIKAGQRPTGSLAGVLGRGARGNWYSPLNADTSGLANFGLYDALGATPTAFPVPSTPAELTAYQAITTRLCGSSCNIRDAYDDLNVNLSTYQIVLQTMVDSAGKNCDVTGSGADPDFCRVRGQLLTELVYVGDIRSLFNNMQSLWLGSGSINILSQLSTFNTIQAQLQAPPSAPSQSLVSPLVNFFLGLASFVPEVGPAFGLADVAFNLATGLTTDSQGNKKIDLTSTIGNLQAQAIDQFTAQQTTTGTLFQLIYQDWGKMNALGSALSSQTSPNSPWYWGFNTTGLLLSQMTPAIKQAAYQNLMAASYAIGGYVPRQFNQAPLSGQPATYIVETDRNCPCVPIETPFATPNYIPFTFPNDPGNQWASDSRTSTILTDGQWLGISQKDAPIRTGDDGYQYPPPSEQIRTLLFDPVWKGGLGIYRPDFFNHWPFPRVQCGKSRGDYDGYSYPGGCEWSTAAVAVEHVSAARRSRSSATIRVSQMPLTSGAPRTAEVQLQLTIHNNGTVDIRTLDLTSVTVRTLGIGGTTTLTGPALPVRISNLKPGTNTEVFLRLNVPLGVTRISVSEQGTMTSGPVTAPSTLRFSEAQAVTIR